MGSGRGGGGRSGEGGGGCSPRRWWPAGCANVDGVKIAVFSAFIDRCPGGGGGGRGGGGGGGGGGGDCRDLVYCCKSSHRVQGHTHPYRQTLGI